MISCSEAVERLWQYLEHELGDTQRADLERHLAFCRRCCGELEFAEELRRFMVDAARPRLPSDVEGRLTSFLETLDAPPDARTDARIDAPTDLGEVGPS